MIGVKIQGPRCCEHLIPSQNPPSVFSAKSEGKRNYGMFGFCKKGLLANISLLTEKICLMTSFVLEVA